MSEYKMVKDAIHGLPLIMSYISKLEKENKTLKKENYSLKNVLSIITNLGCNCNKSCSCSSCSCSCSSPCQNKKSRKSLRSKNDVVYIKKEPVVDQDIDLVVASILEEAENFVNEEKKMKFILR